MSQPTEDSGPVRGSKREAIRQAVRQRYEGSAAQHIAQGLGAVDFGSQIILFGASMLLSVLPLILILSALASNRVDDDISQRLGLSTQGSHALETLFHHSSVAFNLSVFLSLVLSLAGTIAVARSVQTTYEKAFGLSPAGGARNLLRCFV